MSLLKMLIAAALMQGSSSTVTPSGSGLPAVSVADNGKFLQVANGVWVAVDAVPQMMELIKAVIDDTFIPISKADHDALVAAGTVDESKYYMIVG